MTSGRRHSANKSVLILTVGTGDSQNREASLLAPLKKSIKKGCFGRIILLPSASTAENANEVQKQSGDLNIEARPLPEPGMEENVDACFDFFSRVIQDVKKNVNGDVSLITVDFTRGTKAMSAAMVLASVSHGINSLRYIVGKRNHRGTVEAGMEEVREFNAENALAAKKLDLAYDFFRSGDFAAAKRVLPQPSGSSAAASLSRYVGPIADFYAAWDRFDYKAAKEVQFASPPFESQWDNFMPLEDTKKVLDLLSRVASEKHKADYRLALIADVFANAERRIKRNMFEDALLMLSRAFDLVVSVRLLKFDIDPDKERRADGRPAGMDDKMDILKKKGDLLCKDLRELRDVVTQRNNSICTHGYAAKGQEQFVRNNASKFAKFLDYKMYDIKRYLNVVRRINGFMKK